MNLTAGPQLRVVLHTNQSLTSSYCALVPSGQSNPSILWSAFGTDCVTGEGTPYQGQPIVNIAVAAFGTGSADEAYEFCVQNIAQDP